MQLRLLIIMLLSFLMSGCTGTQSTLAPIGQGADTVAFLSWIIFSGAGIIMTAVMLFTAYAICMAPERRWWIADHRFVVWGGIVFPVVTLSILLFYGLLLTGNATRANDQEPIRIEVVGEQFWWRINYGNDDNGNALASANEIHIPVDRPVELTLKTADVIHSFWVPRLTGKLDMIPGLENRLLLRATEPGVARGQCAEYCGAQHAQMALYVVAEEASAYEEWRSRISQPAAQPQNELSTEGQSLFLSAGCGACHNIRGTPATGVIGPDLTHFGSRISIGAGVLDNSAENISRWISLTQHLKPGNKMPSFDALEKEQVAAIAAYLEGLK